MPIDQRLKATPNPVTTGLLSGAIGGALVSALTDKKTAKNLTKAGDVITVYPSCSLASERRKGECSSM